MGILASAMAAAATSAPQLLYTAPSGAPAKRSTVNLLVTNQGAAGATFRAWMSKSTTGAAGVLPAEMVECDTPLTAKGQLGNSGEKTMMTLDPGQALYVGGSSTSLSFTAHGYEEVA